MTHLERVQRHDHAANALARMAARRAWTCESEPHIRCTDGILKNPDLILRKGDKTIVAEVSIKWETPGLIEHPPPP